MLAGRKLLLADDSPTIQKVVELTFADEGVAVVSVSSGAEALERLKQDLPDVVLADVCMPGTTGYEVCEYIKQNAELKHIPVMLLVGSFEPFDEAEARRVSADDILTKPFQSIRRLIDRVGVLVSKKQDPDQVSTAELPQVEETPDEAIHMSTEELEVTTANTQPLPEMTIEPANIDLDKTLQDVTLPTDDVQVSANKEMETPSTFRAEPMSDAGDVLLDLGDLATAQAGSADDFVLDLDLDESPQMMAENGSSQSHSFVEPQVSGPAVVDWQIESEPNDIPTYSDNGGLESEAAASQLDDTQEWLRPNTVSEPEYIPEPRKLERVFDEPEISGPAPLSSSAPVKVDQLSPEMIDAIARRAVEHLSERVVQEIAWEVVPQLAELMIKRKLEEKEAQPK